MRYRAVFFDAGGTLLDPTPSFPERFAMVLAQHGHDLDAESIHDGLYALPQRFVQAAEDGERWTTSLARSRRFWGSVYDLFLERAGLPLDDGLQDALYAAFTTPSNYALYPEVPSLLDDLERSGAVLGVISNFEDWLEVLLDHLGVRDRFAVRVVSGVEGIEKPDPAIFELALRRAGLGPSQAVYVGDVPAFDVDPPCSIGMDAVLVDRHGRHPDHDGPRIASLSDLLGALEPV